MGPPLSSSSPPTPAFVPVDDEPLHRERWKTPDVRLVDVQFPPHTTSLWHQHVHYGVYIALTPIHAVEQSTNDTQSKPLSKQRGDVFCRDHTKDRLTHVVTTDADPMRIIEVELVRDTRRLATSAQLPLHVHRSLVLAHDDARCRVYRISLLRGVDGADRVSLVLPTSAVLVAIHDATVSLRNPSIDDKIHVDHTRDLPATIRTLTAGDDVQLVAGAFELQAVEYGASGLALFILTEVY
jgi:hypothetical protein